MLLRFFLSFFLSAAFFVSGISSEKLIVLPETRQNGIDIQSDPFLSLIEQAEREILMASFKLQEKKLPQKDMLDALERAVLRGVIVHVLTEDRLTNMEKVFENEQIEKGASLKAYEERGVKVHSTQGKCNQSHTKYILIDQRIALIGTTNFDKELEGHTRNERPSRDFVVQLEHPAILKELKRAFWADIYGVDFEGKEKELLWGPEHLRENLIEMIREAKRSIKIYQQDITDTEVVDALVERAKDQIRVELVMCPHPFGFDKPDNNQPNQKRLVEAGGKVFLTQGLNIHAKVMIIDDTRMYLGSTNFYRPAIDQNRNVGLVTENENLIQAVNEIFERDKLISL